MPTNSSPRFPKILLHFHIFKNAGSTLDAVLKKNFGEDWRYVENQDPDRALEWPEMFRQLKNNPEIKAVSSHTARWPVPASPAFYFIPLLLIRHPIDRLASIYYFKRKSGVDENAAAKVAQRGSIADFMKFALGEKMDIPSAVCDAQTSWLARCGVYDSPPNLADLAKAKSVVAGLVVPGVVERMDEYLVTLQDALASEFPHFDVAGRDENRNPERKPSLLARLREIRAMLPEALWREIRERNRLDLKLWQFTYRLAKTRFYQMPDASKRLKLFHHRKLAGNLADLPWTGERLVASACGDFVAEHLHRYALATEFARGCDVLDVACGEGYGSSFLAEVARSVVGVDRDPATVSHAAKKYRGKNLRFIEGSAEQLPLPSNSIDLVVSFETLEHLDDHHAMLREIKRVLKPNGRLLISTPDSHSYRTVSGQTNPFHVHELDLDKFTQLLSQYFRYADLSYQKSLTGSWMVPHNPQPAAPIEYSGTFQQIEKMIPGAGAPYLISLAADEPVPALPTSIFNSEQLMLAQIGTLMEERDAARHSLSTLQTEFADRTAWAKSLEAELQTTREAFAAQALLSDERAKWANSLEQDLNSARQNLSNLTSEFTERTAWAKSLETELQTAREAFAAQALLSGERVRWAKSLEQDLNSARQNLSKVTTEFTERTAWAKSLEAELQTTREAFAAQAALTHERTTWARSLEADLLATRKHLEKARDELEKRNAQAISLNNELQETRRDYETRKNQADLTLGNLLLQNEKLTAELSGIKSAIAPLAELLPASLETGAVRVLDETCRMVGDQRRDLAEKDAKSNSLTGLVQAAEIRAEIAESEVLRLATSITEAQVHVDGLLNQTRNLQQRIHLLNSNKTEIESKLQEREKQINICSADLETTRQELAHYQNRLLCRLIARRPAPNPISRLSSP